MNHPQQPREYDAVLGGNSSIPEGAAVLGGIEGVKLRLQNPDAKVRIAALEQAVNYGEQGLDLVIAGLKDESWNVEYAAYSLLKSRTEPTIKQILTEFDAPLKKYSTDYTSLRDCLALGKWKEADEETARVMLTVAKRDKEAWLDAEHIQNFSCKDIHIIDQLWVKYSNGHFGFSVQKRIYKMLGGTTKYNYKIWCKFGDYVGWRKGEKWLCYSDIEFDIRSSEGHLPLVGAVIGERIPPGWGEFGVPLWGLSPLLLRLVSCNI